MREDTDQSDSAPNDALVGASVGASFGTCQDAPTGRGAGGDPTVERGDGSGRAARAPGLAGRRVGSLVLALSGVVALGVWTAGLTPLAETLRARAFDLTGRLAWPDKPPLPVVVAIDRASLASLGPWPWSRDRLAALVAATAAAGPRAIGLDILFDGPDTRSPAALARRLGTIAALPEVSARAETLPDGDARLGLALGRVPSALGLALDPRPGPHAGPPPTAPAPILTTGRLDAGGFWRAPGAVSPPPALAGAAAGLGVLALPGDPDAILRHAPLLAVVGGRLVPGLALETLRLAEGGAPLLVDPSEAMIRLGAHALPLAPDGMLRLLPLPEGRPESVPALAVLAGDPATRARLAGRIVLIGATAPETGALRPGPAGRLGPSVALHAGALAQIRAGLVPHRPPGLAWVEAGALFATALGAGAAARRLKPWRGGLAVGLGVAGWLGLCLGAGAWGLVALDPLGPPAAALGAFLAAALTVAAAAERQAARIRTAFEQRLAAPVVRRIAETPDALRLAGERREVTALFTDIEGFSELTERAGPEALIALLDGYFARLAGVATAEGGMVAKMIGDAVHVLFNVPFDLPDHPTRALACARATVAAAEAHRRLPGSRALGMGRTRIGIETGPAIVGDVGGGGRLDYTAYGMVMNAAARLEQANKQFGTTVLIGPGLAARLSAGTLMPLGDHRLRGFAEAQRLWTLWPETMDRDARAAFARAVLEPAPEATRAARLMAFADEAPLARRLAERLAAGVD